jgi:hypothetical protein
VVLGTSGKILITGDISQPPVIDVIVVRLNADGSNDSSFATGGIARTDFGGEDRATELLLQLDGKVVAAGHSASGGTSAFVLARYLTAASDEPVLQTEAGTNHAIALDSVTFKRDPFSVANDFVLNPDHRTRVILFATNLTLGAGEDATAIIAQAEDSGGAHDLPVEFAGKVPGFDSLTQIVVRLPDGLAKGNVLVSVTFHAKTSNKAFIVID